MAERSVLGNVHRQRGLAHRGAARDDHEIATLQAAGQLIEGVVARRYAAQLVGVAVQVIDAVDHRGQDAAHLHQAAASARTGLSDLEYAPLGFVHELARVAPIGIECTGDDAGADIDHAPEERSLTHDFRVSTDVGGAGRITRQRAKVAQTARIFDERMSLEMFGQRYHVDRLVAAGHRGGGLENQPVVGAIEILSRQDVGDRVPSGGLEHEPAQDRLFGLDGMRRDPQRVGDDCGSGLRLGRGHGLPS